MPIPSPAAISNILMDEISLIFACALLDDTAEALLERHFADRLTQKKSAAPVSTKKTIFSCAEISEKANKDIQQAIDYFEKLTSKKFELTGKIPRFSEASKYTANNSHVIIGYLAFAQQWYRISAFNFIAEGLPPHMGFEIEKVSPGYTPKKRMRIPFDLAILSQKLAHIRQNLIEERPLLPKALYELGGNILPVYFCQHLTHRSAGLYSDHSPGHPLRLLFSAATAKDAAYALTQNLVQDSIAIQCIQMPSRNVPDVMKKLLLTAEDAAPAAEAAAAASAVSEENRPWATAATAIDFLKPTAATTADKSSPSPPHSSLVAAAQKPQAPVIFSGHEKERTLPLPNTSTLLKRRATKPPQTDPSGDKTKKKGPQ